MFDFGKRGRQLAAENDELQIRLEAARNQTAMLEQQIADFRQQIQGKDEQQTLTFSVLKDELREKREKYVN